MPLDPSLKAKLQAKRLKEMYERRAKVRVKDLQLFAVNMVFLAVGLLLTIAGAVVIAVLLSPPFNGQNAIADISSSKFTSTSDEYKYYVGACLGAAVAGTGLFLLILCLVGLLEDYDRTKKRLIEKVIKEDQDRAAAEAAKNANMNFFTMLAQNIKKTKLAE